jgi:hypothetical protein
MKIYFDEGDNDSYVEYTSVVHSIRANPKIGSGGAFSCIYETDETTFLSNLATIKALRGVKMKVTSDDGTPIIYFTGIVGNIINVTLTSATIIGIHSPNILQDYPANTNNVLATGYLKVIDSLQIIDEYDDPFTGMANKVITIEDVDKLTWNGHVDTTEIRDAADTGDYTPDQQAGTEGHQKYDSGVYSDTVSENYVYANSDGADGSASEYFWFKLNFKVPKKQGTAFTKCTIKLTMKKNNSTLYSLLYSAPNTAFIYAWRNDTSVKTELYDFDANRADWDSSEIGSSNIFSDNAKWGNFRTSFGVNFLTTEFTLEQDITSLIDFEDTHYFYNKTAYNDQKFDLYDFTLYVRPEQLGAAVVGTGGSSGIVLYYAGVTMEYDLDQDIAEGFGDITSSLAERLTLSGVTHTAPFPQNDGWSIGDIYTLSDPLHTALASMFTNSSADSLFTLSADTISTIGDPGDHTTTPILRLLDLYAQLSKKIWYERDWILKLTSTLTSSGLTLTEADIENYPIGLQLSFEGAESYSQIKVVGKNEQVYPVPLSPSTYAQDKIKVIQNPDVQTTHQARKIAENLQTYLDKDKLQLVFDIKLDTLSKRTNIRYGNTIHVNLESNSLINVAAEGNDLVIMDMEYYRIGSYDMAKITLSNKVPF